MPLQITLIAAVSDDGFISPGKGVPWDLPDDREHFRSYTAGKYLLLGRTTYEEMTGWFTDHHPLVLTRDKLYTPPVGRRVPSVPMAIMTADRLGATELVVCGGAQAYSLAIEYADTLVITRVHTHLGQGIAFPAFTVKDGWEEVERREHPTDKDHAFAMTFLTLQRSVKPIRRR